MSEGLLRSVAPRNSQAWITSVHLFIWSSVRAGIYSGEPLQQIRRQSWCPPFCEVFELVQQHIPAIHRVQLEGLKGPNHPLRLQLEAATGPQCFTKVSHSTVWHRGLQAYRAK